MPHRSQSVARHLPLPHTRLEILLALAPGEAHGFAIKRDIEGRRDDGKRLRAGTLYEALARLHVDGLIEETATPPDDGATARWRYYRLTDFGRAVVTAELERLSALVALGQRLGVAGGSDS